MSNSSFNVGDIVVTGIMLGTTVIVPIIFIALFYTLYKKNGKRAEERLEIEKQQTFQLQKQVDELQTRVEKIELLLKEVD